MSANLFWRPTATTYNSLPDALKFVLRDKHGIDGTPRAFGKSDRDYLTGLVDAGIDGAQELLDAIEKHGEVEVWLEY